MSLTLVKRNIIVEGAQLKNGTGRGIGTGSMKDITGTETMTEIGIMTETPGGGVIETETEAVKETGIGIETVIASEMTTTTGIETEIERGMVGKGSAGIEIVAGIGAVQGAGIDEKETAKTESTVEDAVPEGVPRMMARGRSLRRERRRKRRRAMGMVQILMTRRL